MRNLLGLSILLGVAGVFLTSALAFSQAQLNGVIIQAAPAAEKAKVGKNEAKVEKKEAVKKEVIKKEAAQQAQRVMIVNGVAVREVAGDPGEPDPQVMQQYRPMLWAEYHLARSVCDLTLEQRRAIARDAEHAFQEAVAKSGGNRRMGMRVQVAGGAIPRNEPDDTIREGLKKAVTDHLKPDQMKKYQDELDKRAVHRRRITVDNITAKIDESLILSVEQRDKIRESLVANWKDSWCPSPESLLMNSQMLPQIPDQFVVPVLNETQKSIWRGLTKYHGANFRFFGFMANNMMGGGDSPEDDALREAREAETKARAEAKAKREVEEKAKKEAEAKKAESEKKK